MGLLYLLWLTSISGMAQKCEYTLTGIVIDSIEQIPLNATQVEIVGSKQSAISAKNGSFAIDSICGGLIELHVSHFNCEHIHLKILVSSDTQITIYLKHQDQILL
jgi:iron complex outermembrane receptor protein